MPLNILKKLFDREQDKKKKEFVELRDDFGDAVEEVAKEAEKVGDSEAVEGLNDAAKTLEKDPSQAAKKFKSVLEESKLPSKIRNKFKGFIERFEKTSEKIKEGSKFRQRYREHCENVETVAKGFYDEVVKEGNKPFFEGSFKNVKVKEKNLVSHTSECIVSSGLLKYANSHRMSRVHGWCKHLTKGCKEILRDMEKDAKKLSILGEKGELVSALAQKQEYYLRRLYNVLNLKSYVNYHKIKKSSLGNIIFQPWYDRAVGSLKKFFKESNDDCWNKYASAFELPTPPYSEE